MITVEESIEHISTSEVNELSWSGYNLPMEVSTSEVFLSVKKLAIEKEGIQIPFPQRVLWYGDDES